MNEIARYVRALTNIFISGVLLMLAIVNLNSTLEAPPNIQSVAGKITAPGILSLVVYLALVLVTGLFAWAFWRRRATGNSSFVSAILNAIACLLLVTAGVYHLIPQ